MVSLSVLDLNFIHAMYLKTGPLGVAVMLHGESLGFIRNPESIFREKIIIGTNRSHNNVCCGTGII